MKFSRKTFLKTTALAASAVAFPRILPAATLGRGGAVAPNSRIAFASIGIGGYTKKGKVTLGKGGRNMMEFLKFFPQVQWVAVADPKRDAREAGAKAAKIDAAHTYNDFREMLANVDIDAVCVSTPDHWHVAATLACIRRGKAVYCEKPLARTLAEGRLLADTVASLDAKVLVGSQQRSVYLPILRAVKAVKAGRLGQIKEIHVLLPKGSKGYDFKEEPLPSVSDFDYDLWLGPAPHKPYCAQRVSGSFRSISDYSEGMLADWGAHHLDIAQWMLGCDRSGPSAVECFDAKFPESGLYDTPYYYNARLFYPNGAVIHVSNNAEEFARKTGQKPQANGIFVVGTQGTVFCNRAGSNASSPSLLDAKMVAAKDTEAHKLNFLNMIEKDEAPAAPAEIGHRSATLCHLLFTAMRFNKRFEWNPATERFVGENAELGNRALIIPRRDAYYYI